MKMYYRSGQISPITIIGLILLAIGAFFVALPVFLGALVVFGCMAAYLAWRVNKTMDRMNQEYRRQFDRVPPPDPGFFVIDVVPEDKKEEK
ncbi:MAG TPA: hypothetical protein EYP57_07400 [Thermodesulfobacteriaceae bacterium]|nr:hypothetical protein [Thermodesulfobacteriaceae bacterium]